MTPPALRATSPRFAQGGEIGWEARSEMYPARAKVNLWLNVVGRRADGYHLLDSLVAFTDLVDEVAVGPAEELDLTPEKVTQLLEHSRDVMSLDQTVGADEDAALGDFIEDSDTPDADEVVSFDMMRQDVRKVVEGLDERERALVSRRFGLDGQKPYTLEQIGKEFGMSRERVRQIERQTMAKLRTPERSAGRRSRAVCC